MAGEGHKKIWIICVLFWVRIAWSGSQAEPQVPGMFIFGDSLIDSGNNNNLATLARANYQPYGIDFPNGPTGRFCNGRTGADIIAAAQMLGFNSFIPPYATARGREVLCGVNYGSGSAGIRDETGKNLGAHISMNEQLRNHNTTILQIVDILGNSDSVAEYLNKCFYFVEIGSNDYVNNYLMPQLYSTSRQYTPEQYAAVLIQQLSQQIRILYNYGARKVALTGLGPIGCSPSQLSQSSTINGSLCVETTNSLVLHFNDRLQSLVDEFNKNLTGARFIYLNAYGIFINILQNSSSLGFRDTMSGCCGVGRNNGQVMCLPLQIPCKNRTEYLYWDAFHPTEAVNMIIARRFYSGQSPMDTYPMDISSLAKL